MLWKLADNVKYEEDCEVRAPGGVATREAAWGVRRGTARSRPPSPAALPSLPARF